MADCEANVLCQISQIKTDILKLFSRTDDLNDVVDQIISWGSCIKAVSTEQELLEAAEVGGVICVKSLITTTQAVPTLVPRTMFIGTPCDENPVGVIRAYQPGVTAQDIFRVKTHGVHILNMNLSTSHPLTSGLGDYGAAVDLEDDEVTDVSGFHIERCNIFDVWVAIQRSGTAQENSYVAGKIRIIDNKIRRFLHGIYLDYMLDCPIIDKNAFEGYEVGDTHGQLGDAIFAADGVENIIISNNTIRRVRPVAGGGFGNGIEVYLDPTNLANVGKNRNPQIINNNIEDVVYGISALGNGCTRILGNDIYKAKGIGVEVYNSPVTSGKYIVANNSIEETSYLADRPNDASAAISVDKVENMTLIEGNVIGTVISPPTQDPFGAPGILLPSYGIQMVNGAKRITVKNNTFNDCATRVVVANGNGVDVYNIITIADNVFFYSSNFITLFPALSYGYYPAVMIDNALISVVKNNVTWHPVANTFGFYALVNSGICYTGTDAEVAEVAPVNMGQSNLMIPY